MTEAGHGPNIMVMLDLDFYDDGGDLLLKTLGVEELPDFVKVAEFHGNRPMDPNDHALILIAREGVFPRFPITDPGNTALSVHYLMHKEAGLPAEAVETAAHNLGVACRTFRLDVPDELFKLAGIAGKPELFEDRTPYVDVRKGLKISGDHDPRSPLPRKPAHVKKDVPNPVGPASTVQKTASYDQVLESVRAFDEDFARMDLLDRVKLAVLVVADAEPLGIPVREEAYVYARGVPDFGKVKVAVRARRVLSDHPAYEELEKVAELLTPEDLVETLIAVDSATGMSRHWGTRIPDPFLSVMKLAEKTEKRWVVGNDYTTEEALKALPAERYDLVKSHFGHAFADKFAKSPVSIFESLPDPTKQILMRMSRDDIGAVKDSA